MSCDRVLVQGGEGCSTTRRSGLSTWGLCFCVQGLSAEAMPAELGSVGGKTAWVCGRPRTQRGSSSSSVRSVATARQQRGSSAAAARQQPTCRADLCVMSCAVHVGGGSILCDGRWMRETDRGAREAERQTERQRAEWLVSCCDSTCGKTRKGATGRRLLTTAAVRVERNDRMPSSRKPAAAKLHHGMA